MLQFHAPAVKHDPYSTAAKCVYTDNQKLGRTTRNCNLVVWGTAIWFSLIEHWSWPIDSFRYKYKSKFFCWPATQIRMSLSNRSICGEFFFCFFEGGTLILWQRFQLHSMIFFRWQYSQISTKESFTLVSIEREFQESTPEIRESDEQHPACYSQRNSLIISDCWTYSAGHIA